jgi:hypothetical protein
MCVCVCMYVCAFACAYVCACVQGNGDASGCYEPQYVSRDKTSPSTESLMMDWMHDDGGLKLNLKLTLEVKLNLKLELEVLGGGCLHNSWWTG